MKKLIFQLSLIFLFHCVAGQLPVGSWSDRLSYNTALSIAAGDAEIYVSTGSSILVFNREFNELKRMSPVNGLSETGISAIGWSGSTSILIIAYLSSNVDLVSKNSIYNIPDIMNKYIPGNKHIHKIRTNGKYAFLATGFGVVVIDLLKKEVYDTWRPGPDASSNEVFDLAFGNGRIYAATLHGVWFADLSNQGLAYFGNWSRLNDLPQPAARSNLILFSENLLYINVPDPGGAGDRIYSAGASTTLFSFSDGVFNSSIDLAYEGFTVTSAGNLKWYNPDGNQQLDLSSFGQGTADLSQGLIEKDYIWIADKSSGFKMSDRSSGFIDLTLPGPSSNEVSDISSSNGKTIICGGGTDDTWNGLKRPLRISVHENNRFTNIVSNTSADAMRSCIDPGNSSHFFVSSWGDGLFEYRNNELVNHYTTSNSPLESIGPSGSEIRICGLAFDKSNNLWITQNDATGTIKILRPDGRWITYPLTIAAPVIGDIIATGNGQKWITLPGGHGLFIVDDNNTPDLFTDDKSRKLSVTDSDGKVLNSVFSLAEDLEGNVWVGTDQGPVIYKTDRIFEPDIRGYRIRIPRNDGTGLADYLLGTESVTAISVDGANRKWLGSKSSGAYLIKADGSAILKNYNRQNSPIFSDSITSIAVDDLSGEVWIGTSGGVISIRETATAGKEDYSNVYSFPNPVREDYQGNVTITGLMEETRIKITDISGNLVSETMSEGGQASWDLSTYNGKRVKTGVYLVFCANNDGSGSYVTKILVIGR